MKELNNNNIVLNASASNQNQQVADVQQGGVAKEPAKARGYLRFVRFANGCADKDVLIKFKKPEELTDGGLRAANIKDDGFFGCDMIGPLFRRQVTKDGNNKVRDQFVRLIIDSFKGAGDFNLLTLDEQDFNDLKLEDFIGKDKLAEMKAGGSLTLWDLVNEKMVTTGKPLSARRIIAIDSVFNRLKDAKVEPRAVPKPIAQIKASLQGQEACKCLKSIILGSPGFKGGDLMKRVKGEAEGREFDLTIDFGDPQNVNQQAVQNAEIDNESALKKLEELENVHSAFLRKMLSIVSWYGSEIFSYPDINACDKEGVKPHGRVSINLTIVKGIEPGSKNEAKAVTLVVSEAGDDSRAACKRTVKFSIPSDFFFAGTQLESVEITDS